MFLDDLAILTVIDAQGGEHIGDGMLDRGGDGEGIFGLDVKRKREYDNEFRESIHETHRASVQDGTPVWDSISF